jgi:hypothetical protein
VPHAHGMSRDKFSCGVTERLRRKKISAFLFLFADELCELRRGDVLLVRVQRHVENPRLITETETSTIHAPPPRELQRNCVATFNCALLPDGE